MCSFLLKGFVYLFVIYCNTSNYNRIWGLIFKDHVYDGVKKPVILILRKVIIEWGMIVSTWFVQLTIQGKFLNLRLLFLILIHLWHSEFILSSVIDL